MVEVGQLERQRLICFRFGTAVLVTHPVFVEHLCHFLGDHVAIVLNGDERDFFPDLGHGSGAGTSGQGFWCLTHRESIHYDLDEKGELFKGFQRRSFWKLGLTCLAGHKIDRLPDRHRDPKVQLHPSLLATRARYFA